MGFYIDREQPLWIDGEPRDPSKYLWDLGEAGHVKRMDQSPIALKTYFVEWETGERLRVDVFKNRLDLELDVPEERRNNLEGLVGNFNDDLSDDIQLRNGTTLEEPVQWRNLYDEFAESWRIEPETSLFDYRKGMSTGDYQKPSLPKSPRRLDDLTEEQIEYGKEICRDHGGITDPTLLKYCVMDVGCTRDPSYMRTFARIEPPKRELKVEYPDGSLSTSAASGRQRSLLDGPVSVPRDGIDDAKDDDISRAKGGTTYDATRQRGCRGGGGHKGGASSTGDPHFKTIDGLSYSFQSAGEFILMESLAGDDFEIQVRHEPTSSGKCPDVSLTSAAAVQLGEHRVGLYPKRNSPIWIDGEPIGFVGGFKALGDGYGITKLDADEYALTWPDGEYLEVSLTSTRADLRLYLPNSRRGQLQGLFGKFNGDPSDDLLLRDGTTLGEPVDWETLHGRFADSWRISQDESLFDYKQGESTDTYTDKDVPNQPTTLEDVPDSEETSARQTCEKAGVDTKNQTVMRDCIIDVYCTGDSSYADGHAERTEPADELDVERPIFLNAWTPEADGHGNWEVAEDGRSVLQTENSSIRTYPTVFVSPNDYLDSTIRGSFEKVSGGDDDWMGFVFGYKAPLSANNDPKETYDTFVFSWKKSDQQNAEEGFSLFHVEGNPVDNPGAIFSNVKETSNNTILATDFGEGKGWERKTKYNFELTYTKQTIEIAINGQQIFDIEASETKVPFESGRFGFYNHSQADIQYADFSVAPPKGGAITKQFGYDGFQTLSELKTQGSTTQAARSIRLVSSQGNDARAGALWHRSKPKVGDGFSTTFDFRITDRQTCSTQGADGGDGLAFVLQNAPAGWNALGEGSDGLGYRKIPASLAVEFDMSKQSNEPSDNHVSVQTKGIDPNDSAHGSSIASTTSNLPDFDDGLRHTATVEYSPPAQGAKKGTLEVFIDGRSNPSLTTQVDLENKLDLDNQQAFVGLTAGAACGGQNHDLLRWTYDTSSP